MGRDDEQGPRAVPGGGAGGEGTLDMIRVGLPGASVMAARCWVSVVLAASMACSYADDGVGPNSMTPSVTVSGSTIHYVGAMNEAGVQALEAVLQAPGIRPDTFIVESGGGGGRPAMRIGTLVHERGMHVVATGRGCNSACANYVFVPALRKTIRPGSKVVWHNSCPSNIPHGAALIEAHRQGVGKINVTGDDGTEVTQAGVADLLVSKQAVVERGLMEMKAAHAHFFAGRGIDDRVNCLTDYFELPFDHYTLSVDDMARFGVCNVLADPDYVSQTLRAVRAAGIGENVFGVIDMRRAPTLTAARELKRCDETGQ